MTTIENLDPHSSTKEKPWHQVEIINISEETPSIVTVTIKVQNNNNAVLTFVPGQWVDFVIEVPNSENGMTKERIGGYSPLSSPLKLPFAELGIRFNPYHAVSNYLHQFKNKDVHDLKLIAKIRGGSGTCVYVPDSNDAPITFIAGGIGITPILSMIQSALELSKHSECTNLNLRLFYSIRSLEEFAYKNVLLDLEQTYKANFKLYITITQPQNATFSSSREFHKGRWDIQQILSHIEIKESIGPLDYSHDPSIFYVCGPPSMVDKFQDELVIKHKFPKNQVRFEKWW